VFETLILAVAAFASTNIDDAFVLIAFFGDPRFKGRDVIAGQYAGIAALTLAAWVFALLAYAIPDRDIGWLGILPILIGAMRLWKAWRQRSAAEPEARLGTLGGVAVYAPLFAGASIPAVLATCAVFTIMVAAWCFAAQVLVRHRTAGALVRTWGRRAAPFVLIALGAYILLRSGALRGLLS